MRSKIQLKNVFIKVASLPAFKNIIVVVGVLVALLVGFFTLHAQTPYSQPLLATQEVINSSVNSNDSGMLEVELAPEVMIYNQNLELILSANLYTISAKEHEHLNRLLNVCDFMVSSGNTIIYQLDK